MSQPNRRERRSNDRINAEQSEAAADDMAARLFITTIVAHWRKGRITLHEAAHACNLSMTEFAKADDIVSIEAERMMKMMKA